MCWYILSFVFHVFIVFHSSALICPQLCIRPTHPANMDRQKVRFHVSCSILGDRLSCTSGAPAQNCHGTSSWPKGKGSTAHVAWQCVSIYVALLILLEGLKGGYHQFLDSLFLFILCLNDGSRNQNYIEHWFLPVLFGQLPKPWAFGRMGTNFLVSTEFYGKLIWGLRLFPTCQVRVVRFYVSLFSFSFSSSASSSASSSVSLSCRDSVSSVWHAGPQLRSCEFLYRDPVRSVWRAGPQPRSCEFSVACRTPTAILRIQCGVPDLNRDSCEFSVACRTPTAILWVQRGVPDLKYCVRKFVRKNDRRYVRKNDRRYVRRNVKKICQKICQKQCQKICQKMCQKECQKICQKECQKICQEECQEICQKYMSKRMPEDMSERMSERYVRKNVRKNVRRYVRNHVRRCARRYVRKNVKKICQKECQKICQKECQKICQEECQKISQN